MLTINEIKKKVNRYLDAVALERMEDKVRLVKNEREELKGWTDKELKLAATAFRDDLKKGKGLDEILIPAFAVASEAARRIYNQIPYDVQILGGIIIHQGKIAEMKAGEGKTLTETMPVYLNALEGKGVHIITTNDYLAERDAKWMGKLYESLGLSVGYVTSEMKNDDRRKAYAKDITYVTNQEIGFDYLRDNLVYKKKDRVLREENSLHFGIVDEIDSILIDESRTPLIIAEPVKEEMQFYDLFTKIVNKLVEDEDYEVEYKDKFVSMTDEGLNKCEKLLGEPVFSKENPMYVFYLDVCLRAKVIFEKDRDYIITNDGVEIVDEFTGRVLPGRRFTDGVHQAIEAKEKVKVKEADRTLAAITFQNFFPMYEKLSGMSGTVMGARDEFAKVYKLEVLEVPTNKPVVRIDRNDLFFKTKKGKFMGMLKKAKYINQKGQPLLIGARNVEIAHEISKILNGQNLSHQLLTASDHRAEAEKIIQAGQEGMITVATNMAGRGTDILLGPGVEELGGLYVLATERHESRRIDDQLIGRSGRQGEPGESQFLISMEDEIMKLFGSEKIIDTMEQYDIPEDEYISGKSLDNAFKKAQDFVDSKNLDSRIYLYKYDSVINFQRRIVCEVREDLLENEAAVDAFLNESIALVTQEAFALEDGELVARQFKNIFGLDIPSQEIEEVMLEKGHSIKEVQHKTIGYLRQQAKGLKKSEEAFAASQNLILEIIDNQWSKHLELIDLLKQEASLFSYATEDPIVDFVLESKKMFAHMESEVRGQFVKAIFLYLSQAGLLK
ncbi:MAG: preprotein translocase subunit SecA [Candidatus Doudnabacteria bacterium CG10_big_fil_rev_8_21_14_0_10_42_18]|uniref:Protein translocase subunit SecA n=1 Tax=Candidatus Doudnabacteria bacterium CG10_big_fil_rev_8_21_14_0_10_42_18 TaxID=1974552 RepID=A0A2H0VC29_9BACT|nr:MAG: preprotein translocase subunit SecA [Candidatus Doudnabacteria bacterium CG10_big_fil_rev_8_21_14_0_10_42_18]